MLRSIMRPMAHLALPLSLLTANGCAVPMQSSPPPADLRAVTEPKPVPGPDIVTSDRAAAQYSADVESWGDRVSAAGARLCRYFAALGMKVDCPK